MAVPPSPSPQGKSWSMVINRFDGDYRFLSNFYPSPFTLAGFQINTVEHGYQAWKTDDPEGFMKILQAPSPGMAKRLGRTVHLRHNWEEIKVVHMKQLLERKFALRSSLGERLLNTGDAFLVEGNTWGDTYWGRCDGEGINMLGTLLMARRAELRAGVG